MLFINQPIHQKAAMREHDGPGELHLYQLSPCPVSVPHEGDWSGIDSGGWNLESGFDPSSRYPLSHII
jgi:hypothetical protein